MGDTEKMILELCKSASKKNPISRKELKDRLHTSDRNIRKGIGDLRDKGFRIINNDCGYWLGSAKEYKEWLPLYLSYANTIYKRKKAMDNYTPHQLRMVENGK